MINVTTGMANINGFCEYQSIAENSLDACAAKRNITKKAMYSQFEIFILYSVERKDFIFFFLL